MAQFPSRDSLYLEMPDAADTAPIRASLLYRARTIAGRINQAWIRGRLMRLRTILAIAFTVITIVPVSSLAIWMDRSAYRKEQESVQEKHLLLAQHIALDFSRYAKDLRAAFEMVQQQRDSAFMPSGLTPHLASAGVRCVFWMRISDGRLDRRVCAETEFKPGSLDRVIAQANPDGLTFSQVMPDGRGRPTIYLTNFEGDDLVAVAAVSTEYFQQVQEQVRFGTRGHASLFDRAGNVLAHPKKELADKIANLSSIKPVQRMMHGDSGVTKFFSPVKQTEMVAGFTSIPAAGWGIMIAQPVSELEQRAASERIAAFVILIASLLAAALGAWAFSGYLTRSITPVIDAAKANAAGHFGTETGPMQRYAPTDLRELASSFNVLAREIRGAYERQADALETARKAEADYRGIVENTTEGIYRSTADGRLLRANPALVRLCGYETEAELIQAMKDIAVEWYVDSNRRMVFLDVMERHGRVTNFVSEVYRHKSGERIWVLENARAVRDEDGKVAYFEGTVLDITERKRVEEATHRAIEAEAANRTKSEFLAALSHELRTPLNAIIGFSEMMQRATFGPLGSARYTEYAQDIHDSGVHLLNLINDLLDLSKIEGKKYQLRDDSILLPAFIPDVVRLISPDASKEQISIQLDVASNVPVLRADARATKQMLLNLLSNAVKFTPSGGQVTVRATTDDRGLLLIVEDNGIGIDPKNIDKVLAPFGQIEAPVQKRVAGTGLGLSIVKSLIELHEGQIVVDSELGVGTKVSLVFPAYRTIRDAARGTTAPRIGVT